MRYHCWHQGSQNEKGGRVIEGEKRLNTLRDDLLEAIAGGTLTEYDETFFSAMIEAAKEEGRPIDDLLTAVDDVFGDRPELHDEIYQYIFENWGLSSMSG